MKIYVSEKENIDLSKNCFLTFSTKDKETVDWNVWNVLAQSLEQHEEEIRKQERLKVIKELEEWVSKNTVDFVSEDGYFTAIEPDDLNQKLNEMKEV